MPLPIRGKFFVFSNIELVSELRSDFFLPGNDAPIDTRFLVDWKQSLTIPIMPLFSGKLSLSPSVEMILYSNKISDNLYRNTTTSVALNYTFEWRKGLSGLKSLGYSNPVPALPTLPTR